MGWNKRDFTAVMEQGKRQAQGRRNRGQGGGRAAKGWIRPERALRSDELEGDHAATVTGYWRGDVSAAIEDYLRTVYPERYEAWEGV